MKVLLRLLYPGIGFVLCLALAYVAGGRMYFTQSPAYERSEVLRYEAFSPFAATRERHVVIGSCEVAVPVVANNLDAPGAPLRSVPAAWLGNVVNFVLRNTHSGGDRVGFYDLSVPSTFFPDHTNLFYHALHVPGLKSILYVNGVSLKHEAGPAATLELVATLEALAKEYPAAAAAVTGYLDLHLARPQYADGVRRWGEDWRRFVDPVTVTFRGPGADTVDRSLAPPPGAGFSAAIQYHLARIKVLATTWAGGPAQLIHTAIDMVGFDERRRDQDLRHELDWAARQYDRNRVRVFPLTDGTYFAADDAEFSRRWLVMAAELAKARGVKLVLYAQPMIALTPELYRDQFKPHYVDRAAQWLAGYDVAVIDHTMAHNLDQRDFSLACGGSGCGPADWLSNGYWATVIGRYKQARLLLSDMRALGLLSAEPVAEARDPWRAFARLTVEPRCILYKDETECRAW